MKPENSRDPNPTNSLLQKTPIAIIGMGALFPQAGNLQQYWDNILHEVDCISDIPSSRWDVNEYYDPDPRAPDKTYCKRGGFIPDVNFNPMDFGIPPNVLEATDISQLLSLVVAREALENAGYGEASGADLDNTGVILGVAVGRQLGVPLSTRLQYPIWERVLKNSGISAEDTQHIVEKMKAAYVTWQENSFPGALGNVVAGRIANRFNLGGTNCVIDAACASSLSALTMAISELLEHRCDMMLTGGVDTDNSIMMYMCFSKTPAFSQKENVRPFDAESDGMMIGEGIGMLVLKRLEDAERDGDRIYAVIRGIGTSSDGRFKSIYAPRSEGQAKALRRAYRDAGFAPASVGLVEAHGTGTKVGDPEEVAALVDVFGENNRQKRSIGLGSVKSQIGHTKAAAGSASLIKTSLALYHQILPATINVNQPVAPLVADDSPFYLNTKTRPWIRAAGDPPRRAGVSAFGFGGTNFHVVLEEYERKQSTAYRLQSVPEPILLSAQTPQQLLSRCQAVLTQLQTDESTQAYRELLDASNSTAIPMEYARLGFVAESGAEARSLLETAVGALQSRPSEDEWSHPKGVFYRRTGIDPAQKVVALFPGQGSQYVDMGREVATTMPPVREAFGAIDTLFQQEGWEPVSQRVFPPPVFTVAERQAQENALRQTQYAQPAIGAFSFGLYKLLQQANFRPDFVLGHSFGELTALWAAGVMNDADYLALIKARGLAMAAPADPDFDTGAMVAVSGDVTQIQTLCHDFPEVTIANWNSNNQIVLAGPTQAIQRIQPHLTAQGYTTTLLPVSAAFHTALVGHAQQPFAHAVRSVQMQTPAIPVFANATAERYPAEPSAICEMLAAHVTQPVLFKQQIENAYAAGGYCFVEIGPKSVLTNMVKNILAGKPHVTVALNASGKKNSDHQLREAVVQLRVIGLSLAQIDPYQAPRAAATKSQKTMLNVSLSASSYISDKTQKVIDEAIHGQYQLRHPVSGAPKAEPPAMSRRMEESAPSAVAVEPVPNAAQKHTYTQEPMNSHMNNYTNGHASDESPVAPQPTLAPTPAPTIHRVLDGIEHSLSQFMDYQSGSARTHEQYLNHQGEYTRVFAQLMQQQFEMVTQGHVPPEQLAALRDILETLGRSVSQFHTHQGETSRIHEQYLNHQVDSARSFLQLLQRQYAAYTGESTSGELLAYAPAKNGTNGHGATIHVPQSGHATPPPAPPNPSTPAPSPLSAATERPPAPPPVAPFAPPAAAPAPVVSPSPAAEAAEPANTVDVESIATTLLAIVSDKTGYPVEVLEPEMDMEADLGIDSIKRVEILGAMQEQFPDLPQAEPEVLGELRTLGQIIDFIQVKLSAHAPAAALSAPTTGAPTHGMVQAAAAAPTPPSPAVDVESIATTLLAIVSDKTGYPVEVLESGMDMEADLGIDSIKRVEILGAMQEQFPDLPQAEPEALGELRTLGQIIDFIRAGLMGGHLAAAEAEQPAVASVAHSAPTPETVAPEPAPVQAAQPTPATAAVAPVLLDIVSDKTGYPVEVLEPEMDIEADLGIDRVKRVEILGAIRDAVPGLSALQPETLNGFHTLGQLIQIVAAQMTPDGPADDGARAAVPPDDALEVDAPPATEQPAAEPITEAAAPSVNIYRHVVAVKPLPQPDYWDFHLAADHVCLLTDDGSAATIELARALAERAWPVVVLRFPLSLMEERLELPQGVQSIELEDMSEAQLKKQLQAVMVQHGPIGAFIHLHPINQSANPHALEFAETAKALVKHTFLAAKHLKKPLNDAAQQGRSCFVTVARLDGQFGLSQQVDFSVIGAGLCGLTKSLNLEWPSVFCRAMDVSPEMDAEQTAVAIIAELHDPNSELAEVGHSAQGRVTLVAQRVEAANTPINGDAAAPRIDADAVFLVSGGGKGITAECVIKLAEQHQCKFILLGRSSIAEPEPDWAAGCSDEAELKKRIVAALRTQGEKPTPMDVQALYNRIAAKREVEETLQRVAQAGGQAVYLAVDITDAAALQAQLAEIQQSLGSVTGIIHGAGNLADKWIEKKTEADFELVYSTKVKGLENLLHVVPLEQLRHLVLFTSTAGFYGNIGQTDYALGNEVLNKVAHMVKRHHPACHAVAINWGPWDGGMVTPALKRIFAMQNIQVIPIEVGTQMLVDELRTANRDVAQLVVSGPVNLGALSPQAGPPSAEPRTFQVRRSTTIAANPFLRDHTVGDQYVLPLTCAASWMIHTSEHLNPGYHFAGWTDLQVLKGILPAEIPDGELTLDLREVAQSHTQQKVLEATIWSRDEQDKQRYHYKARLRLEWRLPAAPVYDAFTLAVDPGVAAANPYADGTLFHGPSFQGIERILNLSEERVTLECVVPAVDEHGQGQFIARQFDPYTTDVQLQGALIWTKRFKAVGCLPAKMSQFEWFEPIPTGERFYVSMNVRSYASTKFIADIVAHDAQGRVYSRLQGAEYTVSRRLNELFAQTVEARS